LVGCLKVADVVCSAVGAWVYVIGDGRIVGIIEGFAAEVAEVGVGAYLGCVTCVGAGALRGFRVE
jgi:hypothetical protein